MSCHKIFKPKSNVEQKIPSADHIPILYNLSMYIYIYPVDLGLANGFCSLDPQAGACYTKIGQDMLFWVINVINVVFHVTRGKASEQPSMI